jgi:hypothetical protein
MKYTLKQAKLDGGNVSSGNTKMPGTSYALDAFACNVGSRLRDLSGSVCSDCYAIRIQKFRPNVDKSYKSNQELVDGLSLDTLSKWVSGVVHQIKKRNVSHHRWLDAGDVPSVLFLQGVMAVCLLTPAVKHWLPTRELGLVKRWLSEGGYRPANLCVRVSAPMVGDSPVRTTSGILEGVQTSTVHIKGTEHEGVGCEASLNGNNCGDCRACWDINVPNVSYPRH